MAGLSRQYKTMPVRQENILKEDGSTRTRKTKEGKYVPAEMVVTEVVSKSKDFRNEPHRRATNRRRKRMGLPLIHEKHVDTGEATIIRGTPKHVDTGEATIVRGTPKVVQDNE